jgi:hypothetical protein
MATRTINTQRKSRLHQTNLSDFTNGNWGLIRHTSNSNPFTSLPDTNSTTTEAHTYTYDDNHGQGEDVDIIFITGGMIYTGNTEYQNSDGTSRIQQFQWNTLNNLPNQVVTVSGVIARPSTDRIQINTVTPHGLSVGDTITLSGVETAPYSIGNDVYIPAGSPDVNDTYTVTSLGGHNGLSTANQFLVTKSMDDSLTTSTINGVTLSNDIRYYMVNVGFDTAPQVAVPSTWNTTIDYSTSANRSAHAEAVVKCACANDYGAATKSNIYIIPRTQVSDSAIYWVLPKLFHQQKGNNRPTLVINSFGDNEDFDYIKYIDFRGSRYRTMNGGRSLGAATSYENDSFENGFHNHNEYRVYRAADSALINEMTAAGVHHILSAGNAKHKIDVPGGIDYNNKIHRTFTNTNTVTHYYNRGTYNTNDSILVGNLHSWFNDGNTTISDTSPFKEVCPYQGEFTFAETNRGPRVDCYVSGTNLSFQVPNTASGQENTLNGVRPTGTSYSAPILGGLAALVLSKYPTTTPAQLRKYFRDIAVSSVTLSDKVVQPSVSDGDYGDRKYMHHNTSQNSNLKITYLDPSLSYDPSNITDTTITYPTETLQPLSSSSAVVVRNKKETRNETKGTY